MAKQPKGAKPAKDDPPKGKPQQPLQKAPPLPKPDEPMEEELPPMERLEQSINDKKETVFVTGSNGRLGKEVIKMLLKKGDIVRALVKKREYIVDLPAGVIPFIGDLTDARVCEQACEGADTVMHFAAIVSEYKAATDELMRVNVDGTRNLLDAVEKVGGVNHFLYPSSVDVYGKKRKEVLTEDKELKPTDKYGYSKMLAEYVIERYKGSVPYTVFRMANIYGPGFEAPFFKLFKAIKDQKAYVIGSGQNSMPLLHVFDAMRAFILAKNNQASRGKIYNLTDGNNYTQEQLMATAAQMLHVPKPTFHVTELIVKVLAKQRGLDSDELRFLTSDRKIDITKVRNELKFSPMVTLDAGGRDLVERFNRRIEKMGTQGM